MIEQAACGFEYTFGLIGIEYTSITFDSAFVIGNFVFANNCELAANFVELARFRIDRQFIVVEFCQIAPLRRRLIESFEGIEGFFTARIDFQNCTIDTDSLGGTAENVFVDLGSLEFDRDAFFVVVGIECNFEFEEFDEFFEFGIVAIEPFEVCNRRRIVEVLCTICFPKRDAVFVVLELFFDDECAFEEDFIAPIFGVFGIANDGCIEICEGIPSLFVVDLGTDFVEVLPNAFVVGGFVKDANGNFERSI